MLIGYKGTLALLSCTCLGGLVLFYFFCAAIFGGGSRMRALSNKSNNKIYLRPALSCALLVRLILTDHGRRQLITAIVIRIICMPFHLMKPHLMLLRKCKKAFP